MYDIDNTMKHLFEQINTHIHTSLHHTPIQLTHTHNIIINAFYLTSESKHTNQTTTKKNLFLSSNDSICFAQTNYLIFPYKNKFHILALALAHCLCSCSLDIIPRIEFVSLNKFFLNSIVPLFFASISLQLLLLDSRIV